MICIAMYYLEAILQRIISTIVFVCVRPSNRSELLYRHRQHFKRQEPNYITTRICGVEENGCRTNEETPNFEIRGSISFFRSVISQLYIIIGVVLIVN
jgi:hypothetical protein